MYIFNTTYHIENSIKESFLDWLREVYIPSAMRRDELSEPQLCRVCPNRKKKKRQPKPLKTPPQLKKKHVPARAKLPTAKAKQ